MIYGLFIAWAFLTGLAGGFYAVVAAVQSRRDRVARQNRIGQSREPRPPLPRRVPERVHTPESCDCTDCNAYVAQVQATVAAAIARAEIATWDREWADLNGDAS